ncbi:MAG: CHAT domain-containing protein [Bacteroidales bacterium]|nr:CHAT domain-containing protein [Bacteroidales bacterium]
MRRHHFTIHCLVVIILVFITIDGNGTEGKSVEPETLFRLAMKQFHANQPDSALLNFRQFLYQSDQTSHNTDLVNTYLHMADIKRSKQEFDSALIFLGKSRVLLQKGDNADEELWADYYHKQGAIFLNQGNHDPAIDAFNKSVSIRKRISGETDTNLVLTFNNLGITSYYLGLFDQAMGYYQKAINIIELGEISENRHVGLCFMNTGILYATLGDYILAGHYFSKAQSVYEQIYETDDISLGRFYLNFGRMVQLSGKIDRAIEYYDRAENIFLKGFGPDNISIGIIYLNKANIYNSFTDYERAFNYINRAMAIFQQNLSPDHPHISAANLSMGYYYEKKEDYPKAIEYYQKSINEERITPSNIATYRNMANLYSLLADYYQAELFYIKAIDQSIGIFGARHTETALSYVTYSRFLTREKRFNESHELLQKAKNIYLEKLGSNDRDYSNTLFRIGSNYLEKGDYAMALNTFQESIISLAINFSDKDPLQNPHPDQLLPDQYLINSLYLKAKTLHELYKSEEKDSHLLTSLETYELSSNLINKIRSAYLSNESKLIITGITSEILIGALDCSLDLYKSTNDRIYLEKAFEYSEKGKAAVLLSSLNDLEARQLARVPDEVQRFERDLTLSLDSYNQLIHEERLANQPDEKKINLWQSITFNLNQRYDSLINAIYQQYPDYYALRFDLSITPLPELQKNLDDDQALIEFTLSEQELYIFAITNSSSNGFRFTLPKDFQANLEGLREHLSGGNIESYTLSDYNEFVSSSHEIYKALIKPVEEIIAGRKLIIVPDNQLGYLPFEVLLTNDKTSGSLDFKLLPYLIKTTPVSYAYSATLMQKKQRVNVRTNGKIFAVAPSYGFGSDSITVSAARHNELLTIPWAIDEAKSLIRSFRGVALTGSNASESNFKEKAPDYQVLHMAMHTLIDNDNPMFSKLVFSQVQDSIHDGYLNTYELFNLELNADLAVLSACQTGDGRLQRGEGIMSMARGFFYAGVPSIIMTLWEVDDHSSSELITLFYKHLATGADKNIALQAAKLEYLEATDRLKAHPHYWAGFVNIGNTEPVLLKSALSAWLLVIPLVLLISLAVYLSSRKRRNRK